jgi:CheY-like chemotaxis protein
VADVLVVDDDADIRAMLTLALELDGHVVRVAENGEAGIGALLDERAAGKDPVVLLDVQMPDIDGWEVLSRIRGDDRLRDASVILCTVKVAVTDHDLGWRLGCDGYQSKPFNISDVSAQVTELAAVDVDERWRRRRARAGNVDADS